MVTKKPNPQKLMRKILSPITKGEKEFMLIRVQAKCPMCEKQGGTFIELKPRYHRIALTVKVRVGFICMQCGTYANGECDTTLACYQQGRGRVLKRVADKIFDSLEKNKPEEEEDGM